MEFHLVDTSIIAILKFADFNFVRKVGVLSNFVIVRHSSMTRVVSGDFFIACETTRWMQCAPQQTPCIISNGPSNSNRTSSSKSW